MKRLFHSAIFLLAAILVAALAACEDKIDFPGGPIEEGVSIIDVELDYKNFTPALDSRSSGTAIKHIKSLWLFFYDRDGKYLRNQQITDFKEEPAENTRPDGAPSSETETARASFKLKIDNGYYRIYVVANHDFTDVDSTAFDTPKKLKDYHIQWQEEYDGSDDFHSPNAQMFGWFINGSKNDDHGTDAPEVAVRNSSTVLHAWLTRAASKVTICFNTVKLSDDVNLYIKSVQIKDIPKYCHLGSENAPGDDNNHYEGLPDEEQTALIHDGEMILFANAAPEDQGKADHGKWLLLQSGDSIHGPYSDRHGPKPNTPLEQRWEREHKEAAPGLYFFENLQGKGIEGTVSDKRQDVSGNNLQISYPEGTDPENKAWKDAKPFGSYIEVKGYYENNGSKRPGKGDIIYRFMLGKDHITDYNAKRNHHYRLTLNFNGQANDVDFHIDYREEAKPGLHVQDTTYVSYLYNQEAHTTLRATPRPGYDLVSIKAYMVENEWRPFSEKQSHPEDNANPQHVAELNNLYNTEAWDWQVKQLNSYAANAGGWDRSKVEDVVWTDFNGVKHTEPVAKNIEFGFLSLRKTVTNQYEFDGYGDKGKLVANFRKLFFNNEPTDASAYNITKSKHYRDVGTLPTTDVKLKEFGTAEIGIGHITRTTHAINKSVDYVIEMPLFTRAMTIDSWAVYSGANAFYHHHRYARVIFVAKYNKNSTNTNAAEPATYEECGGTVVLQARRIDNPRGIYRSRKNGESFNVVLCYSALTAQQQQEQIPTLTDDDVIFNPVISRGAWTATIEKDPSNLVKLTANGQTATGEGNSVTGRNGTQIQFTYTPNSEPANGSAYGATIMVRYHNNSCTHRIVVRRGYDAVALIDGGAKWSSFNIYDKNNLTMSPLSIGSTFRRHVNCYDYPIAESNNYKPGYGIRQKLGDTKPLDIVGRATPMKWNDIPACKSPREAPAEKEFYNDFHDVLHSYRLPTTKEMNQVGIYTDKEVGGATQIAEKPIVEQIGHAFGICYADGATKTLFTKEAYSYSDPNNKGGKSKKGVRGVLAYNVNTATNIFFPFGSFAQPRRRLDGMLQYGSVDKILKGDANNYRPMAYSLIYQSGGCYFTTSPGDNHGAIDFNGGNYMSSYLGKSEIFQTGIERNPDWSIKTEGTSDALPIKPIRTN